MLFRSVSQSRYDSSNCGNQTLPQYVDLEEAFDFLSSMNVIRAAEEAFNAMPAGVS